jgi:hypothetical protein
MPILNKSPSGTVTGLWGSAFIRLPSGKLKPLSMGDKVKNGEHIVTTQDGIVQISPANGKVVEVKAVPGKEVDRVIAAIENNEEDEATGAGLRGGAEGGFQPGLRVDRVREDVGQQRFEFDTHRGDRGDLLGPGEKLFSTTVSARVSEISSPTATEGQPLDFVVRLTGSSTIDTTVTLTLKGVSATLGADTGVVKYSVNGGQTYETVAVNPDGKFAVVVPKNSSPTALHIQVETKTDNLVEGAETVKLSATTNPAVAGPEALGTINDATLPTLSINNVEVNEAAGVAIFTVKLSVPSTKDVTVNYGTQDGTATAGSDYTATSGTLTIKAGSTTATISVPITNDSSFEGIENYTLVLSNPSNATVAKATGIGGINDQGGPTEPPDGPNVPPPKQDDDRPLVKGVSSPTANEGGDLNFVVTLSNTSTTPTTITLKLAGITATPGTDTKPVEFSVDGGKTYTVATVNSDGTITVTLPKDAAADALRVKVPTVADGAFEGPETLSLTAQTPLDITKGNALQGAGTIKDTSTSPAASDDTFATDEGQPVVLDVLKNDTDADGDALKITEVNGQAIAEGTSVVLPGQGTVTLEDGKLLFTPEPGFNGEVAFSYTVTDGVTPVKGTVDLTVNPVNEAPEVLDDIINAPAGTKSLTVNVLDNDSDPDGSNVPLTITAIGKTPVQPGDVVSIKDPADDTKEIAKVTVNADGTLKVEPAEGYTGPVTFEYTAADPSGATDSGNVACVWRRGRTPQRPLWHLDPQR